MMRKRMDAAKSGEGLLKLDGWMMVMMVVLNQWQERVAAAEYRSEDMDTSTREARLAI